MTKHDTRKLQNAFDRSGKTLCAIATSAGVSITTVHRVIKYGVARPASVDAVARALGFKHGRKDLMTDGRTA